MWQVQLQKLPIKLIFRCSAKFDSPKINHAGVYLNFVMHVLFTLNSAWNAWNFRAPLIKELIARGHRVTIFAPPDNSVSGLKILGAQFVPLNMTPGGLNPFEEAATVKRHIQVFRQVKPDVVLGFTAKNNVFGSLAARLCDVPFIPNVTGLGTAFLSGSVMQRTVETLYKFAFHHHKTVFFQNTDDRHVFLSKGLVQRQQCQVLPGSGIDLQRYSEAEYPPKDTIPTFLMVSRLLRDKGVVEFIQAARRLKEHAVHCRFQLLGAAGSCNRTAISSDDIQVLNAEGIVQYLGATSDVRPFMRKAHCVVLPSYREGAPRTLIEASALGRPCITTTEPGCRAVVENGVTGLLCASRDSGSLANTMTQFLTLSHSARSLMGRSARQKMEYEFDQSLVIDAYLSAISDALSGRSIQTGLTYSLDPNALANHV